MTDKPNPDDLLGQIQQYLRSQDRGWYEPWTEDTLIVLSVRAAISAGRQKGYCEAELHLAVHALWPTMEKP